MQIPKIFHYQSQYYVHYKSYNGREEERDRVSKRNRDRTQSKNKHNISKFPNSQNPKAEIETQNDYLALKNSIYKRKRDRESDGDRTFGICLSQTWSYYNHSEAI